METGFTSDWKPGNIAGDYSSCCRLKSYNTCETIEESFKDIEMLIAIKDVSSVEDTPSKSWKISAAYGTPTNEVLHRCKIIFSSHLLHSVIRVERMGYKYASDGRGTLRIVSMFLLTLNNRLNKTEIKKYFERNLILKVEGSGFITLQEFLYWKNYVTKNYPFLASKAFRDSNETEQLTGGHLPPSVTNNNIPKKYLCQYCHARRHDHLIYHRNHSDTCNLCYKCARGKWCLRCGGKISKKCII